MFCRRRLQARSRRIWKPRTNAFLSRHPSPSPEEAGKLRNSGPPLGDGQLDGSQDNGSFTHSGLVADCALIISVVNVLCLGSYCDGFAPVGCVACLACQISQPMFTTTDRQAIKTAMSLRL